jgi:hypothetical protein
LYFYCIKGISETTDVSSDVYCQSNNDNHDGTSCAFYVESIQVKHRGELGRGRRKREQDIADWGERERMELAREYGVGFYIKDSYFWF